MAGEAEEKQEGSKEGTEDIKNLKSEFSRKFENQTTQIQNLEKTNKEVLSALNVMVKQTQSSVKPKEESNSYDDMYDNPEKFVEDLTKKVTDATLKTVNDQANIQSSFQQAVNLVVTEFPELGDAGTDLYKQTMELVDQYPEYDRQKPEVIKAASYQAAVSLGVKPMSKREKSDDEIFSLSSSGNDSKRKTNSKSSELDSRIIEAASLMGLDTSNKEVMERLKKRDERTVWDRWR